MSLRVGSLADPDDVRQAVDDIAGGSFVALQYHGAFIMVFSGTIPEARTRALAAKGEAGSSRPLSSLGSSRYLWPYVDAGRVHEPVLKDLLGDNERYRRTVGAICHVRLPLSDATPGNAIPEHMVSAIDGVSYVQSLEPTGNVLFAKLAHELGMVGVPLLAGSSLNRHGEDEIVGLEAARAFCEQTDVPYLLHDPLFGASDVKGSFPVIDVVAGSAVRDGHVPMPLIDAIVGFQFDMTDMRPAKHEHSPYFETLSRAPPVRGTALRGMILTHLYGPMARGS